MYTAKGYVGSEEKLRQYFTEYVFEGKTDQGGGYQQSAGQG